MTRKDEFNEIYKKMICQQAHRSAEKIFSQTRVESPIERVIASLKRLAETPQFKKCFAWLQRDELKEFTSFIKDLLDENDRYSKSATSKEDLKKMLSESSTLKRVIQRKGERPIKSLMVQLRDKDSSQLSFKVLWQGLDLFFTRSKIKTDDELERAFEDQAQTSKDAKTIQRLLDYLEMSLMNFRKTMVDNSGLDRESRFREDDLIQSEIWPSILKISASSMVLGLMLQV